MEDGGAEERATLHLQAAATSFTSFIKPSDVKGGETVMLAACAHGPTITSVTRLKA